MAQMRSMAAWNHLLYEECLDHMGPASLRDVARDQMRNELSEIARQFGVIAEQHTESIATTPAPPPP